MVSIPVHGASPAEPSISRTYRNVVILHNYSGKCWSLVQVTCSSKLTARLLRLFWWAFVREIQITFDSPSWESTTLLQRNGFGYQSIWEGQTMIFGRYFE